MYKHSNICSFRLLLLLLGRMPILALLNNKEMNKIVHLSNTIEQLLLDVSKFTTSADVVMKASGLRFEAVRAIAREQGVEIEDQACS